MTGPAGALDSRRMVLLSAAGLVAVTLAAYASARHMLFVGDDFLILRVVERGNGLGDVTSYFRVNFFGFYRPLAFLSQAVDWELWRENAFGFHLTNLALHAATTLLVFAIARRLLGAVPALAAALLFALHASNEEAVFWVSARFDLLATFWMMLALWIATRAGSNLGVATAFALALLSKESAFSFPLIIGAYDVFIRRANGRQVTTRLLLMLVLVAAYTGLRSIAGGPELGATLGRFGKVGVLAAGMAGLAWLAHLGYEPLLLRIIARRRAAALIAGVLLVLVACAIPVPVVGDFMRQKLAFAAFVGFYLCSPVIALPASPLSFGPAVPAYWVGGLVLVGVVVGLALLYWRHLLSSPLFLFAAAFVAASVVPVSSMTEGKRYLYLASAGAALLAGFIVEQTRGRFARGTALVVALYLALSVWQIEAKAGQWTWAGNMTRDAVRLVERLRGPECVGNDVLLLTAPVAVHDVYSHLYRDTFITADGCGPRSVRALLRVVGHDVSVKAGWMAGGEAIEMEVGQYLGDFVASRDLRHFDTWLPVAAPRTVDTIAGRLEFRPRDGGASIRLAPNSSYDPRRTTFLYFSQGAIRLLAFPTSR
jgi:hypothetical protein